MMIVKNIKRLAYAPIFLGLIWSIPSNAQSTLNTAPDFDDPRMVKLRSEFSQTFGDIRDLSFEVETYLRSKNTSFINYFHSPLRRTQTFGEKFVRKFGGRIKNHNTEFSLIVNYYGDDLDCFKRDTCTLTTEFKILDNRDQTVLYSSNPSISCPSTSAKKTNRSIVYCPADDQMVEEMYLTLAD
jgi:hypothetical protein